MNLSVASKVFHEKIMPQSQEIRSLMSISLWNQHGGSAAFLLKNYKFHSDWLALIPVFWFFKILQDLIRCLTHCGRATHICISKLSIIGSDNGLSPGWCQAIIWTNARILLFPNFGTNFSVILSEINIFSLTKMHLKMLSGKWGPFCLSLNFLAQYTNYGPILLILFWCYLCEQILLFLCIGYDYMANVDYMDLAVPERLLNYTEIFTGQLCKALWGRATMAAILQTTYSDSLSWMKVVVFWYKFNWNLFLKGTNWQYTSIALNNGIATKKQPAFA